MFSAPYDLDAERAILGCAMLDPTCEIAKKLDARWFYEGKHDKLARLIRTLVERGMVPDTLVVSAELRVQGFPDQEVVYVSQLAIECPTVANADSWVEILKEKAEQRRVTKICAQAELLAREGRSDAAIEILRAGVKQAEESNEDESKAVSIMDLERPRDMDPDELLGDRYLCRAGGLLLVGPTGVGKSSFSMQAMLSWAIGRDLFGIRPARPLKSLLIQAENDDGDLAEVRDGVTRGLILSDEERDAIASRVFTLRETRQSGAAFCSNVLRRQLEVHQPDLLWIDPVLSYLGGDANTQTAVGAFLRNGIAPLLSEFGCAVILVHHTNKPPSGREKPDWSGGDFAYLGSGSAEWANWPRAVLAIRSVGSSSEFELIAGKRGGRLKWVDSCGVRTFLKRIQHAQDGSICWELSPDIGPTNSQKGRPKKADENDVLELLAPEGLQVKEWMELAQQELGISASGFYSFKKALKDQERIHHSKVSDKWQPLTPRIEAAPKTPKTTPKSVSGPHSKNSTSPLGVELFVSGTEAGTVPPRIQAGGLNGFY